MSAHHYSGDTREEIDRCLSCPRAQCNNCLGSTAYLLEKRGPPMGRARETAQTRAYKKNLVMTKMLVEQGLSDEQIAETLNCPLKTALRYRRECGYLRRKGRATPINVNA